MQRMGVEHNVLCLVNSLNSQRRATCTASTGIRECSSSSSSGCRAPGDGRRHGLDGARKEVGQLPDRRFDEWCAGTWEGLRTALRYGSTHGRDGAQHLRSRADLRETRWPSSIRATFSRATTSCGRTTTLATSASTPYARWRVGLPAQIRAGQAGYDAALLHGVRRPLRMQRGMPKGRFISTPEGAPGLNYLCEGYMIFYRHIAPYMRRWPNCSAARSPALVMRQFEPREGIAAQPGATTYVRAGVGGSTSTAV